MTVLVMLVFAALAVVATAKEALARRDLRRLRALLSSGVVCQCGHLECVHTDEAAHGERACRANDSNDQPHCACRRFSPLGGLPQLKTRATLELGA